MHSKALVLANLPEDPAPTAGLKTVLIQKGDYRKGLVPNKVIDSPLTMHAGPTLAPLYTY